MEEFAVTVVICLSRRWMITRYALDLCLKSNAIDDLM